MKLSFVNIVVELKELVYVQSDKEKMSYDKNITRKQMEEGIKQCSKCKALYNISHICQKWYNWKIKMLKILFLI